MQAPTERGLPLRGTVDPGLPLTSQPQNASVDMDGWMLNHAQPPFLLDYEGALIGPWDDNGTLGGNVSGLGFLPDAYGDWLTDKMIDEIKNSFFMYKETATIVLVAIYCLTFVMGLIGNVLVIHIFASNRHMRTVTNSFLVNLAVCDLLVVFLCMPFTVAMEVYQNWVYGDAMCKIVNFGQGLAISSSILTLTVISAERFYAIRRPLRARAFMSRTRIQRIAIGIWLLAALAVLPNLLVRQEVVVEELFSVTMKACMESWRTRTLKHAYNFALLFLLYITPVSFICIGYLQIGLNLWRTESILHAGVCAAESENARANLSGRRKVAKMLFVMALLFALSWFPIHIYGILLDFLSEETLRHHGQNLRYVHSFFLWLGHANSTINPICYCIMSTSFKAAIRFEFRRCWNCAKAARNSRMSFRRSMSLSMGTGSTSNGTAGQRYATPQYRGPGGKCYRPLSTMNSFGLDQPKPNPNRYQVDYV